MLLPAATPYDGAGVLAFLAARAIPGVEAVAGGVYRRAQTLAHGPALIAARPVTGGVEVELRCAPADEPAALSAVRRLFGLTVADPAAIDAALGADPLLAPLVARRPGVRVPGAADGFEIAVRAVLGQQISVVAARGLAGRIVTAVGTPLPEPAGPLTHTFPEPRALASAPDEVFPMPRTRAAALRAVGAAVADGLALDAPGDAAALQQLRGIGPWTAGYVALRLGDADIFLAGDVVVRSTLAALGGAVDDAERWRPWRSHAVLHLWREASARAAAG